MIKYDLDRAREAIQFLVDDPYFQHHLKKIRSTVLKPRTLPFKAEAESLNELVKIGRQSEQALENLIAVADHKRIDRNAYQAQYMAQKRARDRKVIQIEELLRGGTLSLDARMEKLRSRYDLWDVEKAEYVERRSVQFQQVEGKEPSWMDKNNFMKAFWDIVSSKLDVELDNIQQNVEKAMRIHNKKVLHNQTVVKNTSVIEAMKRAIDKH